MKRTILLIVLLATVSVAHGATVASITGPDGGSELVDMFRFVSFRWVSSDAHFGVSISARLAAEPSGPFEGTAFLTFGPCCDPSQFSGEIAHNSFVVTSQTPADYRLFSDLTLPPNSYYLTLAGDGPTPGFWVVASPIAFLTTGPDTGIAGGDTVASGVLANPAYPPMSEFTNGFMQTKFAVTDNLPEPEPSGVLLLGSGAIGFWIFRRRLPQR
jgi:hypothetical protein